jgi:hypothetical protein
MILVRGRGLPNVSGFFLDAGLSMATHPGEGGELMSVLTPLGGHPTTSDDFDGTAEPAIDPALVGAAVERWTALLPAARTLLRGGLQLGVYAGQKIDHPSGALTWFVGDAGLSNLRYVWPVTASLARPAALELVEQLEGTEAWRKIIRDRRALDARLRGLTPVAIGEEKRLGPEVRWCSPSELGSAFGLSR